MKVSARPAVLISPDALRRNILLSAPTSVTDIVPSFGDISSLRRSRLTLRQTGLGNLIVPERDHGALQYAFRVDTARIDADGLADIDLGPAFVDVPVKAQQWLLLSGDFG